MSTAGGHHNAALAAGEIGFATLQLFTKNNNQWNAKPLSDEQIRHFAESLSQHGLTTPVAHNSYLINLASPDEALWNKSIDAMVVELERAEALGIAEVVAHPGAHVGSGEAAGLARIAAALDEVHRRSRGFQARIDLETTAGQGSCLGHRFEHLQSILEQVAEPERLGICVDTCHVFAAGYSLDDDASYNATIEALERAVGLGRVRVLHLNDSVKERGSRVDRHAGIGLGRIGLEPFRRVVTDPRFVDLPMILETPKGVAENGEDLDTVNLRVLRGLYDGTLQTNDEPRPTVQVVEPLGGRPKRRKTSGGKR
jgi:deoxyribonuclease-4